MSLHLPFRQSNRLLYVRLLAVLLLVGSMVPVRQVLAQQSPANFVDPSATNPQYDLLKLQQSQQNLTTSRVVPTAGQPVNALRSSTGRLTNVVRPSCFEPYDTTANGGWTAVPRNDDGSVGPVALGWNFSLFGTIYNSVYINNNGNITFNAGLSAYTPGGFPISTPMVAAFWADVDTRNPASGRAWYKLFPDRLVVTWSYVGYYDTKADKTNTFQLTIKANTAAGFAGNDVIFAYDDMQWTTGSASGGTNGFGGSAATVGVNKGNSVDYIQTGRFNLSGSQPPNIPTVGTPGGIDFLDGQCLGYRVGGGSGNVPPAVAGFPANTTISLNQGDTRTIALQFSGPEVNQNVNVTTDLNGLCNTTANLSGNNTPNPTLTFSTTASPCNAGTTQVVFTATDNGTPSASQSFTLTLVISPPAVSNQPPVFHGPIPNQTGTVGVGFGYTLPTGTFTDPNNDLLTYGATGLPPGITFANGVFSGTPTAAGSFTTTITATDPGGLFATGSVVITISTSAPTNQAPVFHGPLASQTGTVGVGFGYTLPTGTFTDPNNDLLTYGATGLPPGITFANGVFSGTPTAAGSFTTTITATDPGGLFATGVIVITIANAPVGPGSPFMLTAPAGYTCATGAIIFNTTGGNGTTIEYRAIGVTDWTTNPNQVIDLAVRNDVNAQPITMQARQSGVMVTLPFDWRGYCNGTPPTPPVPPVVPGSPFSLTTPGGYTCATGAIVFRTVGGDGTTIEYRAIGVTDWTTNPNQVIDLAVRNDIHSQPITMQARQSGVMVTLPFDWRGYCAASRVAAEEPGLALRVNVLGNPSLNGSAEIEIRGAEGSPLQVNVFDMQGRSISDEAVDRAGSVERRTLPLGRSAGLYFLRVSTPGQVRTVKIVKP